MDFAPFEPFARQKVPKAQKTRFRDFENVSGVVYSINGILAYYGVASSASV